MRMHASAVAQTRDPSPPVLFWNGAVLAPGALTLILTMKG